MFLVWLHTHSWRPPPPIMPTNNLIQFLLRRSQVVTVTARRCLGARLKNIQRVYWRRTQEETVRKCTVQSPPSCKLWNWSRTSWGTLLRGGAKWNLISRSILSDGSKHKQIPFRTERNCALNCIVCIFMHPPTTSTRFDGLPSWSRCRLKTCGEREWNVQTTWDACVSLKLRIIVGAGVVKARQHVNPWSRFLRDEPCKSSNWLILFLYFWIFVSISSVYKFWLF